MILPPHIPVYGNPEYRGPCPKEGAEQSTFFNALRKAYPKTYGRLALHPKNEGKRTSNQTSWDRAQGMATGASDIIIPGNPAFVCELKRRDHAKSSWQKGQREYLTAAQDAGAFVCVALGWDAAWEAFTEWRRVIERTG